jgi:toxin ParE1/3/4
MPDLRISPEAEADLDNIWLYVATESRNTERADSFLDRFAAFFSLLAQNPYLGRRRDDLRPGYRSFPIGAYVVIYRIAAEGEILIVRIIRGSRDIQALVGE